MEDLLAMKESKFQENDVIPGMCYQITTSSVGPLPGLVMLMSRIHFIVAVSNKRVQNVRIVGRTESHTHNSPASYTTSKEIDDRFRANRN